VLPERGKLVSDVVPFVTTVPMDPRKSDVSHGSDLHQYVLYGFHQRDIGAEAPFGLHHGWRIFGVHIQAHVTPREIVVSKP
jgi:hypothetical protein